MKFNNHLIKLLFFLLLVPFFAQAQEQLTGLRQNPIIVRAAAHYKARKQEPTAVKLPFREDFSNYVGYPDSTLWLDRYAFVNNTFAIYPPTIGVATLDALNDSGRVYSRADRDPFSADTLTSVRIRLDSNFTQHRAMRVSDSLYFSFYYQPGGGSDTTPAVAWQRIGDSPESDDRLILEFGYATGNMIFTGYTYGDYILGENEHYLAGDSLENPFIPGTYYIFQSAVFAGETIQIPTDSIFGPEFVWNEVWSTDGQSLDDWLAENPLQYFKQVMIPITDPQYLRNNFQFRFRNYASLDLDSWSGNNIVGWASNCDQWNIDYIRLNVNRNINDLYPNDVAFVSPTTSALKLYQSMPWQQFRTSDMAANFHNDLSNLSSALKNTFYHYEVVKNHNSTIYTSPVNNENAQPYSTNGLHTYANHATPAINFTYNYDNADSATYSITHVFRMEGSNDERLSNDTCRFEQKFYNYYAYDDGTAESGYCLLSTMSSPAASLAVQFKLAQPDTLRCVRMWFNSTLNDENIDYFTLRVWGDNNGQPGEILYSLPSQLPEHADDYLDFVNYYLDEPLAVSGTFYVGFYQSTDVQLNLGFDQNNDARGHFFYKTSNDWHTSYYKGAPMIRPVLGKFYDHSGIVSPTLTSWQFYPNPTTGNLHVKSSENIQDFQYQISDIYGRILDAATLQEGIINLSNYASGIYIVKILNNNQIIKTEKIIKK